MDVSGGLGLIAAVISDGQSNQIIAWTSENMIGRHPFRHGPIAKIPAIRGDGPVRIGRSPGGKMDRQRGISCRDREQPGAVKGQGRGWPTLHSILIVSGYPEADHAIIDMGETICRTDDGIGDITDQPAILIEPKADQVRGCPDIIPNKVQEMLLAAGGNFHNRRKIGWREGIDDGDNHLVLAAGPLVVGHGQYRGIIPWRKIFVFDSDPNTGITITKAPRI